MNCSSAEAFGTRSAIANAVLRITVESAATEVRFTLEGKLAGAWVRELQKTWQEVAAVSAAETVVIDLKEVTFVDNAGRELLCQLYVSGATLKPYGCMMRCLVDDIMRSVNKQGEGKCSEGE